MLKKFWNYQMLLSGSLGLANEEKSSKFPFFFILIYSLFLVPLYVIFGNGGLIFYPLVFTLHAVYCIANSRSKLFEIVPVSRLYAIINIYLYFFVMTLSLIAGGLISLLSFEILALFTSTFTLADTVISILLTNWKGILVINCISIIMVSILLPIFFIMLNSLRKTLTISVVILISIALISFKNTLPVVPELGKISFLESITIMSHYNEILLMLACACVVILPISMLISYKLYKGRRRLIC